MVYVSTVSMINALGNNTDETTVNLTCGIVPGIRPRTGWLREHPSIVLTDVNGELPATSQRFNVHHSRNNRLSLAILMQIQPQVDNAIARFGRDHTAVILDANTSGLDEGGIHVDLMLNDKGNTDWHYPQQELDDPPRFPSHWLALGGPAFTFLATCLSSARAIMNGYRLIGLGLVDIAIAGGADTLSRVPINGFHSLESLSPALRQPFGRDRCGVIVGKSVALMVLTREPRPIALLGAGEFSDAYHISIPHPRGEGAIRVVGQVLDDAGTTPEHVGYINLHGATTSLNGQIKSNVVSILFGEMVPCSLAEHLTGHTLDAAGITEAAINILILQRKLSLPPQNFSQSLHDETLPTCDIIE